MIISRSFFKGIISIPNVDQNKSLFGNSTELDLIMVEGEREILTKCLGYSLYKEFMNQFEDDQLKENADQKWKDLLNGKEYEIGGETFYWKGLRYKSGDLDVSLIAYYVFCQFLENDFEKYLGTGVQKDTKGKENVSPNYKLVKVWRKFFELTVGDFFSHEVINKSYGSGIDFFGSNPERSLYQFINDINVLQPNTYSKWRPYLFENKNQLGL